MKRLLPILLCVACGPSALQLPPRTVPALRGQGFERTITTVTDLDTVRDVAEGLDRTYVATDRGLLVYGPDEAPTRLGRAQGLGSDDVRAVTVDAQGTVFVATAAAVVPLRGAQLGDRLPSPPVGEVVALAALDDGTLLACGTRGIARRSGDGWEGYGEAVQCTGLWPTPQGRVWIGTAHGLLYVDEDDVIREHAEGRGLPAGWVRGVVPTQPGQAFVLVQNASESYFAFFDGSRWYSYTVPDFERPLVGLGRVGTEMVAVTRDFAFVVSDAGRGSGVPLRALGRGERLSVRSYRARITAGDVPPGAAEPLRRAPVRMAAVPPNHPTVEAPGFVIAPLGQVAEDGYLVRRGAGKLFVADRNRGVAQLGSEGVARVLRSRDLVAEQDLQIASDERGKTWVLTDEGLVAIQREEGLRRVPTPEGLRCGSLAEARQGIYLGCVVSEQTGEPNAVRVLRRQGDAWTVAWEGTLSFGVGPDAPDAPRPSLVSIPMLAIQGDEEALWLALRVTLPDGTGPRLRGLAEIRGDRVVYHHAHADPAVDGEGALLIPDELSNIDASQPGKVWLSTLLGAVRLGDHQAITFGEARGVRGEVVSDVLVAAGGKVWIAAAEGPGFYFNRELEFRMPQEVRAARPLRLAMDRDGNIWGAGPNGLVRFDGTRWTVFGEDSGLPITSFVDVEADAAGQLWLLGRDRVLILGPERRVAAAQP